MRLSAAALLLSSLTLCGCLAVAAGAAGGAAASSQHREVQRYIDTHEVEPRIAEAMYEGEIVAGMTKQEARFVLGLGKSDYSCEEKKTGENTEEWVCEDTDPMHVGKYSIYFENGKVEQSEIP